MKPKLVLMLFLMWIVAESAAALDGKYAVRGVWLTNVDSKVLNSRESIFAAVNSCASLGFNTIFVFTWNKAMTTYPSAIMRSLTGVAIDTQLVGRDPLKELIEAAHKKNIRVIAWFEFGFSSSYQENGGPLLRKKPHWAARGASGELVTKNGFEWMNGFMPEVQDFVLSLIMEVVENYEVDGIQGDDRLPAMPSESGYDEYTIRRYQREHAGALPPKNPKDPYWIQWRANILSDFMRRIYDSVKSRKSHIVVSVSPSIYPWSKEEYLQDWPRWVRSGWVDLVHPQIYRYDLEHYTAALDAIVRDQVSSRHLHLLYPGVLLRLGGYHPSKEFLVGMIEANRKRGINGEVMFFYEGLSRHADVFRQMYRERVDFPPLSN